MRGKTVFWTLESDDLTIPVISRYIFGGDGQPADVSRMGRRVIPISLAAMSWQWQDTPDVDPEPDPLVIAKQERNRILYEKYRGQEPCAEQQTIFDMWKSGKSRREIARIIGVTPSTVRYQLWVARAKLNAF